MKIPPQYLPLMPYLILKDATGFIEFAKEVFEASEQLIVPTDDGKIMHGELRIYDAVVMLGDAGDVWGEKTAGVYLYVPDVNRTYHNALTHGATSLEPPQKKGYGFTAGFDDPFGNSWFIVEGEKG